MNSPRRNLRHATLGLIASAGIFAAGCDRLTGPAVVVGARYTLTSYGDKALPIATVSIVSFSFNHVGDYTCDMYYTSSTITLLTQSTFEQVDVQRGVFDDGRPDTTVTDVHTGTYTANGSTVTLAYQSPVITVLTIVTSAAGTMTNNDFTITRRDVRGGGVDPTVLRYKRAK